MERLQKFFLALLAIQIIHSSEEYVFHFYDVFPLLPYVADLFQTMPQAIFFSLNLGLILFLFAFSLMSFAREKFFHFAVAIFAAVELLNGILHVSLSLASFHYYPGAASGLLFIPTSLYILNELRRKGTR